jgi:hypothetical protein
MVLTGLRHLAAADPTAMAAQAQAECLLALEQGDAISTAARARILAAFTAGRGYSADADYSPTSWLIHRTKGDLTPGCAAVVTAVLDALSAPAGAEDTRSHDQRYHDALEDAMRRLVASGLLPESPSTSGAGPSPSTRTAPPPPAAPTAPKS